MQLSWAHELLGVTADTPLAEVKKRYRARARMMHPDSHQDPQLKAEAARLFQELNKAWEVIDAADRRGLRHEGAQRPHAGDIAEYDDSDEYDAAGAIQETPRRSIWRSWKTYAAIAAVATGWWYWTTQSSFVSLNNGSYSCRSVFVNSEGKYQTRTSESDPAGDISSVVEDDRLVSVTTSGVPMPKDALSSLRIVRKGTENFHATRDNAAHSYNAFACRFVDSDPAVAATRNTDTVRSVILIEKGTKPAELPVDEDRPVVPWDDAIKHVGETRMVCGPLRSISYDANYIFLNLGLNPPDKDRFAISVGDVDQITRFDKFERYLSKNFAGEVCAVGRINHDGGAPWIVLNREEILTLRSQTG